MAQSEMFQQNVRLILGLLVAGTLLILLLAAVWAGTRVLLFYLARWRAQRALQASRLAPDGRSLPSSAGVCESCGQVRPKVYHLPAGKRQCEECLVAGPAG
jgi:hypothetical protein